MNQVCEEPDVKVVIIVGLPGSGKTTYAESAYPDFRLMDDPAGPHEIPEDIHENIVVTSPFFCREGALNHVMKLVSDRVPDADLSVIYFENDPEQCLLNSKRRLDKPVENLIRDLSEVYHPPEGALPVWSPGLSHDQFERGIHPESQNRHGEEDGADQEPAEGP